MGCLLYVYDIYRNTVRYVKQPCYYSRRRDDLKHQGVAAHSPQAKKHKSSSKLLVASQHLFMQCIMFLCSLLPNMTFSLIHILRGLHLNLQPCLAGFRQEIWIMKCLSDTFQVEQWYIELLSCAHCCTRCNVYRVALFYHKGSHNKQGMAAIFRALSDCSKIMTITRSSWFKVHRKRK